MHLRINKEQNLKDKRELLNKFGMFEKKKKEEEEPSCHVILTRLSTITGRRLWINKEQNLNDVRETCTKNSERLKRRRKKKKQSHFFHSIAIIIGTNITTTTMAGNINYFKGVVVTDTPRPPLTATGDELLKMLKVIEQDILPLTEVGVSTGSKMFGAAILDENYGCLHPDTNTEALCPTFHAEVKCIVAWSEKTPAKDRGPIAQSSIFLATHEPCMMCVSSIVWGGWNKCWYFFGYENTTAQGIPHDINTMHELWGVNSYRKQNKYLSSASILEAIEALPEDCPVKQECITLRDKLMKEYDRLSNKYHTEKVNNPDNSLVLG